MGQTSSSISGDSTSSSSLSTSLSSSSSIIGESCPPQSDIYNDRGDKPLSSMQQVSDFPPSDGYRWRKYGQKSVKGSAFARNYYKCTFPGCTVKKQVEKMSAGGKLVDHVSYKGEHCHEPPQITRLNAPDQQSFRNSVITESLAHTEIMVKHEDHHETHLSQPPLALMPPPLYDNHHPIHHPTHYGPPEHKDTHISHPQYSSHPMHIPISMHSPHPLAPPHPHPSHMPPPQSHQTNPLSHPHPHSHPLQSAHPHPSSLPHPTSHLSSHPLTPSLPPPSHSHSTALVLHPSAAHPHPPHPSPAQAPAQANTSAAASPRLVIETNTDVDHLDDGYHWRKYGQKTVKGSPYPRSYYKCTEKGCSVKKQVEQNGNSIVNTYEGTHTHLAPVLDDNSADGMKKKRRPRRPTDPAESPVVPPKKRALDELPPQERGREADGEENRLADQQKRARMHNMVEEITNQERAPTGGDHGHHSIHHNSYHNGNPHSNAPVLPLINRQLMEPVPSSLMNMLHHLPNHPGSNNGHHHSDDRSHMMNYFSSSLYPPSSQPSNVGNPTFVPKLPHPPPLTAPPYHSAGEYPSEMGGAPHHNYGHVPFTLPPPTNARNL